MSYRRPRFAREESWRYKRVKEAWRAPKGKTSRMRRSRKGWPRVVKAGYGRSSSIKGMHPSGLREVLIWRPKDLELLDPNTQVARIAHTVGENKRGLILEEAAKRNIRILNPGPKKAPEPEMVTEPEPTRAPSEEPTEGKEEAPKEVKEPKPKKKTPAKKRKSRRRGK